MDAPVSTLGSWPQIKTRHLNILYTIIISILFFTNRAIVLWSQSIHPFSSCSYPGQGQGGSRVSSSPDVLFDFPHFFWRSLNTSLPARKSAFTIWSFVLGRAHYQASKPPAVISQMQWLNPEFLSNCRNLHPHVHNESIQQLRTLISSTLGHYPKLTTLLED